MFADNYSKKLFIGILRSRTAVGLGWSSERQEREHMHLLWSETKDQVDEELVGGAETSQAEILRGYGIQ